MQKAIEVLEIAIANPKNIYYSKLNQDGSTSRVPDEDRFVNALQTAINHLQRKVKKCPRVDGLPEHKKERQ